MWSMRVFGTHTQIDTHTREQHNEIACPTEILLYCASVETLFILIKLLHVAE